ncbi:hypothetical protein M409DRAFT_62060 [Zasmidium cellare ATCC 36951]|uniref:Zn(2)-C6 fungal-type domain-containing protein n=1 Tax=Zasmidium cellare ATCC 36951 TaxID=1080233 RepID=A0A6A6D335_ZASCE|nr:uncharacterized protein M409DRAFT_62060 [Zasmidium cellare ATCC 36951]KAF2173811.1 hypothetical protein M409DRAFT_62060 [Zasmidium cellare ATCC 36951]
MQSGNHVTYADDQDGPPASKRPRSSMSKSIPSRTITQDFVASDNSQDAWNSDPLDYPRRRATIACEVCRSRKSRCNGARPKCKLCTELNAECVYREPGVKLDAGDKLILERLAHIEGLLQSNLLESGHPPAARFDPTSPATSHTASDADIHSKRLSASVSSVPMSGMGISMATNISTMPKAHTTPALHLLQWPVIRDLVSKPCDPSVLLQLEMTRAPLDIQHPYTLDLGEGVQAYARAFFDKVNVWYACVSPHSWHDYFRTASNLSFRSGAESCVVLLVLALGQAAYDGHSISRLREGQPVPGMDYFSAAWTLLPSLMVRNDIISAQCHILAAAYLLYIVRPLEAWNMLCNASMKLQLNLSSPTTIPPPLKELSERIYWNTLMIESDLLAELDLPHSGIVSFEESMRLPRSFPTTITTPNDPSSPSSPPPGPDDIWYFLAEIALRRLLNRVSHTLYSHKRHPLTTLDPIVSELDYQLTQWYENLPAPIRFPRDRLPAQNPIQTVLRLRYFACRTIIFRPYIQAVLQDEHLATTEPAVQAACGKCLDACVRQVENLAAHREGHLPYLWQGVLSITSQTLLLMGATLAPVLAGLLPPKQRLDAVFKEVIVEVEGLEHLAPSLRLCGEIIREAEERRRVLLQRPR